MCTLQPQTVKLDIFFIDKNVTPQISGVIFFFFFFFFFSNKGSMYFSYTYPKYIKLYCSNIFLQNTNQGHNSTFFLLTVLRERRLLVYLKGGVPRRGEQSSVVIISYKGYSPPKCTCNDCTEKHIQVRCLHECQCMNVLMPISRVTHRLPHTYLGRV